MYHIPNKGCVSLCWKSTKGSNKNIHRTVIFILYMYTIISFYFFSIFYLHPWKFKMEQNNNFIKFSLSINSFGLFCFSRNYCFNIFNNFLCWLYIIKNIMSFIYKNTCFIFGWIMFF